MVAFYMSFPCRCKSNSSVSFKAPPGGVGESQDWFFPLRRVWFPIKWEYFLIMQPQGEIAKPRDTRIFIAIQKIHRCNIRAWGKFSAILVSQLLGGHFGFYPQNSLSKKAPRNTFASTTLKMRLSNQLPGEKNITFSFNRATRYYVPGDVIYLCSMKTLRRLISIKLQLKGQSVFFPLQTARIIGLDNLYWQLGLL